MEKSRSTVVFRFFRGEISIYLSAMISAHLLEVIQSHAESLHGFGLLPNGFKHYEGTGEKKELWHCSRYSIALIFGKSGTSSYHNRVRKPMENKNCTSQRISLKISVVFESVSNGGEAGAESKRKSRRVNVCRLQKCVQARENHTHA